MEKTVHRDLVVALVAAVALVEGLAFLIDIGRVGQLGGLVYAVGVVAVVSGGLAASGRQTLSPADRVTLTRAVLTCGVAAMVADAFTTRGLERNTTVLVVLVVVALLLDALDGPVARLTQTATRFGARFDMECDALLILVLAVHVAQILGWWVLAIGAARYVLLVAQRGLPWLRGVVPPKRWRKAVAASIGAALTLAASRSAPREVALAIVAAGLASLVLSFGTEVAELWRNRGTATRASVHATTQFPGAADAEPATSTAPGWGVVR